jgi:hypothetical protein
MILIKFFFVDVLRSLETGGVVGSNLAPNTAFPIVQLFFIKICLAQKFSERRYRKASKKEKLE